MLVLGRTMGPRAAAAGRDTVVLTLPTGEVVRVRVRKTERGKVFLGIDAPPSVKIRRAELADAPGVKP